jgi:GTP-binding protein
MFIDEITLHFKAGSGGDGALLWRHEKGRDKAGPGGGDGGDGGDFYVRGVSDISKLSEYKFEKNFSALDGGNGMKNGMKGSKGDDFILELPYGSVVKNLYTEEEFEILDDNKVLILKGGKGGFGNEHFKSSKNVSPKEFTVGSKGEESDFYIELKLVAHLGLVGLPNAGKSSLITSITNSKSKVANYQFTTLFPHLGDLFGFIIADIPGIIEGAAEGKGLGFKFLKHIERTKAILHLIDSSSENPINDYKTIRKELSKYSKKLADKKEFIVLTKTDLVDNKKIEKLKKSFEKKSLKVFTLSILDDDSLKNLKDELVKIMRVL